MRPGLSFLIKELKFTVNPWYNKGMIKYVISLWLILSIGQSFAQSLYRDISQRPTDSVNAESMRIWIPVSRVQAMVEVTIYDDSMRVVRHLLKSLLKKGYHNIYWDKKDDSGFYVPASAYWYELNNGGEIERKPITVRYRTGENSLLLLSSSPDSQTATMAVVTDSARLTIEIYDVRKRLKDIPILDSLFVRGEYSWQWLPPDSVYYGRYTAVFIIGEFEQQLNLVYKRR